VHLQNPYVEVVGSRSPGQGQGDSSKNAFAGGLPSIERLVCFNLRWVWSFIGLREEQDSDQVSSTAEEFWTGDFLVTDVALRIL